MPTSAENLLRADAALSDFDTNGGLMEPAQAMQFIDMVTEEPTILKQVRVIRMPTSKYKINRLGFGGRITRAARQSGSAEDAGGNNRYVRAADRGAPISTQIELNDDEVIAEIRLPYELLEDNIEGMSMEAHVMRLIVRQMAMDMEELALWGDSTSSDPFLALQDGWLKRSSAHIADNLGMGVNPDLFANAMLALPQKYMRNLAQMKGFVSVANTIRYRQKVSQRQTGYGDSALQQAIPLAAYGLNVEGAPMLAGDGIGATGLMTFPQNLLWGIKRDITVETDKDIRSREYIVVVTARVAVQVDDADATVRLENI